MELKDPESQHLALRLYSLDLVLRGICAASPEISASVRRFVDTYEWSSLFGDTPDGQREAIAGYARRVIGPAP